MSKRTVFTTVSPLPAGISRQVVLAFLHNHLEMIDLNPLVKERHPIRTPPQRMTEDEKDCVWYSLTDRIDYLPGGKVSGDISYSCAFHNLQNGVQTHCFAPLGVDIREKWTLCGSLPGEPPEPVELGLGAPSSGLYIREDCDLRCNLLMTSFVKKNLKRSHATLVQHLVQKSQIVSSSGLESEVSSVTMTIPWSTPNHTSTSSSPPSYSPRTSYSGGYSRVEIGTSLSPQSSHPIINDYKPARRLSFQDEEQNNHENISVKSNKYRPYSQYDARSQPSPLQVPFALRVPMGPAPAELPDSNAQPSKYTLPPPAHVDPALYPTPLRVRGLSVGSNTTIASIPTSGYTITSTSSSTLTHASSQRSVASTRQTSSYSSKKASVPNRIIAPPEQHPEYPQLNPYAKSGSCSSGGSSPSDDYEQPGTPEFPAELMGLSLRGAYGGDERKPGWEVVGAEYPAILRPGVGAGMTSRLSGPFLTEFMTGL